ncbi:MAG: hypothetical protein IPJ04_06940 [Candidatus Eisenbacteria bacterium]|nr:hypothetical protein [Candidatus Eisenbacteria bacterium]
MIVTGWTYERAPNDVYAQRLNASGVSQWTVNGVVVCSATLTQFDLTVAEDGSGGVLIAWSDSRATYDIYAQRLNGSGVAQWAANGVVVCNQAGSQTSPSVTSDSFGGATIAWEDFRSGVHYDVYAQRITAGGTAAWGANGVGLHAAGDQASPGTRRRRRRGLRRLDGRPQRRGRYDRLHATPEPRAGPPGRSTARSTPPGPERSVLPAPDGSSGFFVSWRDGRNLTQDDVYAQRVGPARSRAGPATAWPSARAPPTPPLPR